MNSRLSELLRSWALRDAGLESDVFIDPSAIQYMAENVYKDYEPAQFDLFEDRLDRWLHNVADENDQQTLFRLLDHLFFIGRREYESLYRAAFHGPVLRWLVDLLDVDISGANATELLNAAIDETWFCPVTDSMRINSFLKVNKLEGQSHRPDWRSLRKFGDPKKILSFMSTNKLRRLVLLEDFVGSGTQLRTPLSFAASLSKEMEVLAVPLVTCPGGVDVGEELARQNSNVAFAPVLTIEPSALIKPIAQPDEPAFFAIVRDLISRVRTQLSPPERGCESYHGFEGTGAVVVMYSNCPNNTLPIIHDETLEWQPLFPRITRR